jgi:hypothetical protein
LRECVGRGGHRHVFKLPGGKPFTAHLHGDSWAGLGQPLPAIVEEEPNLEGPKRHPKIPT